MFAGLAAKLNSFVCQDAFFHKIAGIWDVVKRVCAGVKAIYGDDSSQYEMVGGTPMSERKRDLST